MTITLEERVQDIEIGVKRIAQKLNTVVFLLQKIEKDGLKVKVIK